MKQLESDSRMQLGHDAKSFRYYRNAVERHWDPHAIDLSADRERVSELDDLGLEGLERSLARFGAGEAAVTEDLSPLAVVLEDVDDQMFVTTQLYEEAKHADFFDRYWREVVHPEEERRGAELSSPLDDQWFNDGYVELFERNEAAMHRLLEEDTPENRARAYCHYHLTIEGILAQTGYYGLQTSYGPDRVPELPHLPGLYEGFSQIRSDEGRHVGFGMAKLKDLVGSGQVEAELLHETVGELLPLVESIVQPPDDVPDERLEVGLGPEELTGYAAEKHTQRLKQITDASESIPDVDELVALGDG